MPAGVCHTTPGDISARAQRTGPDGVGHDTAAASTVGADDEEAWAGGKETRVSECAEGGEDDKEQALPMNIASSTAS